MKTKRVLYVIALVLIISPMILGCSNEKVKNQTDKTNVVMDSLNYYYMSAFSLYCRFLMVGDSLYNDTVALDKSLDLLNKGLTINPNDMKIHSLKSMVYVFKRCYHEALSENDALLRISKNNPEVIFARATIYNAIGDNEKSKMLINECLFQCDSLLECGKLEESELNAIMHLRLMATEYIY